MTGVEIDMIVPDSLKAFELYKSIFQAKAIEVSHFAKGSNEAVLSIYGTRFHLMDANEAYGLKAPEPGQYIPLWINLLVEDIAACFDRALAGGCTPIQTVTRLEAFGVSNAILADPFGYQWMLHQLHHEVSYEERVRILEEDFGSSTAQA